MTQEYNNSNKHTYEEALGILSNLAIEQIRLTRVALKELLGVFKLPKELEEKLIDIFSQREKK